MNSELIFFDSVYKETLWGCEDWLICAHQHGDCTVSKGEYANEKLSKLWAERPEVFGNYKGECFPLLLKIVDAKTDLSIQVHPDNAYARLHEEGSLGKDECWYILDCEDDSSLVIGHNAKNKEEFCRMADEKRFDEFVREVPIKKGDFVHIASGTVHAIRGGVRILETQTNSDISYRVYDYDRLQNGVPRQLHLDKCKDVITYPQDNITPFQTGNDEIEKLLKCDFYEVYKINVKESLDIKDKGEAFKMVTVIEGEGTVNGERVSTLQTFLVPNGVKELCFRGNMTLVASNPV